MQSIWKYQLEMKGEQLVEIPNNAILLDVQVQNKAPCLWAMVDPDRLPIKRKLFIYGTGELTIDGFPGNYIATFQADGGALVFHVFDGG